MADDNVTKVVLDLDNADFTAKMRESLGLIEGLGNVESLANLTEKLVELGAVIAPVVVTVMALKAAFDLTKEGEHIEQVNRSFEMLAKSAGLAGDALKEKLIAAAGGLAGETELLQAANRAIVEMGGNAAKIPETMEIARKATVLFGGDLVTNFENINRALANGNERMLRQYGITIDGTKAQEEYAKQLGIGVEFLSEAGRKQAIMNAALEQAKAKFKDINTGNMEVTTGSQKLIATFKELYDTIGLVFKKIEDYTHVFKDLMNGLGFAVDSTAYAIRYYFGIHEKGSKDAQENTKKEIALEKEKAAAQGGGGSGLAQVNMEKLKAARTKFEGDLLKIRQDREKAEEQIETRVAGLQKAHEQEMVTAALEASHKIEELRVQGLNKGLITQEQYAAAVKNIQVKLEADVTKIRQKYYQDEVTALKNLEAQNKNTAAGIATGWKRAFAQQVAAQRDMGAQGAKMYSSLQSHAVTAFQEMGKGAKDGGDIIKGFMLGTLGDIATQWGEFHLINGVATYNYVEVAEGGALIALGAALQSMGSSSGSSSSAASSGGGGGAGGADAFSPPDASAAPAAQAAQQKHLTVAINGNIFETEQTRTRLVDMIREASDATDFQFTKVGSTF